MLNGLLSPSAGHVHVGGSDVAGLDAKGLRTLRSDEMSMVFQHFAYAAFPIRDLEDRKNALGAPDQIHVFGTKGFSEAYPVATKWLKDNPGFVKQVTNGALS